MESNEIKFDFSLLDVIQVTPEPPGLFTDLPELTEKELLEDQKESDIILNINFINDDLL